MKEQAQQMKAMYDKQNLAEHAKKCKEMKAKKAPTHDKINKMVAARYACLRMASPSILLTVYPLAMN